MELTERCTSTFESNPSASGGARNESTGSKRNYWGVLCKTCKELVAFDSAPYASFGPKAFNTQPGAICCEQGHTHIYFPRDFGFSSAVCIDEAVMRENRKVYRTINVSEQGFRETVTEVATPAAKPAPDAAVSEIELVKKPGKPQPESLAADPRRQAAQAAAKLCWTNWAILKGR